MAVATQHRFRGVLPVDPDDIGSDALYRSYCECEWVSEPVGKDEAWELAAQHFLANVKLGGLSGGSCRG